MQVLLFLSVIDFIIVILVFYAFMLKEFAAGLVFPSLPATPPHIAPIFN